MSIRNEFNHTYRPVQPESVARVHLDIPGTGQYLIEVGRATIPNTKSFVYNNQANISCSMRIKSSIDSALCLTVDNTLLCTFIKHFLENEQGLDYLNKLGRVSSVVRYMDIAPNFSAVNCHGIVMLETSPEVLLHDNSFVSIMKSFLYWFETIHIPEVDKIDKELIEPSDEKTENHEPVFTVDFNSNLVLWPCGVLANDGKIMAIKVKLFHHDAEYNNHVIFCFEDGGEPVYFEECDLKEMLKYYNTTPSQKCKHRRINTSYAHPDAIGNIASCAIPVWKISTEADEAKMAVIMSCFSEYIGHITKNGKDDFLEAVKARRELIHNTKASSFWDKNEDSTM